MMAARPHLSGGSSRKKGYPFLSTTSPIRSSVLLLQTLTLLLIQVLVLTPTCLAYKDSNIYPWGENPNIHFKMYWRDASNVLQDLNEFQALYIQVHGCVWSECLGQDNWDDDGENHDGDETWYESRTHTFCANAAYSLYGIRKNNFKLVNTCSKGTYINTFFTYGGADTLAKAMGMHINTRDGNRYSATDDDAYGTSNSDCVAVENNGRDLSERQLSGSNDENKYSNQNQQFSKTVATTMGCAASATSKYSKFVLAGFSDEYCSGRHFLETLDSLRSYNKAMHKVNCHKIWSLHGNHNSNNDDANDDGDDDGDDAFADDDDNENRALAEQDERHLSNDNNNYYKQKRTYGSVAEEILYHSWACDLNLYPQQCPDPYGLKRKYYNVMESAANGQPIQFAVWNARLRKPIQIITWLLGLVGMYLTVFAYTIRNRTFVASNGGGIRGFGALILRDIGAACIKLREQVARAKERHMKNRKSRRSGGSSSKSRSSGGGGSSSGGGMLAALFGKKKKKKKKKKRNRKLHRTPSGRSIDPEEGGANEDVSSVYTELTDEYSQSNRSSRFSNAHQSSSRTSRAAEAAFAAAAQYDLEQQQQHEPHSPQSGGGNRNRHHHPAILPSSSYSSRGSRGSRGSRRSRSAGRPTSRSSTSNRGSRSAGRSGRRSHSPAASQSSRGSRSQSLPRRMVDASPTRSPGGSRISRSSGRGSSRRSSKSPQARVFV